MSASSNRPRRRREGAGVEPQAVGAPPAPEPAWREPLERARHALAEWLSHLIVVAGLLLGFHAVEALLHFLGQDNRLLFARVPLTYLFDAGDAALVIGFLIYGIYSVLNAYRS
jgi:hypothetical protein